MAGIQLPCTLFETQKWMDDYRAADMRCGDVSDVPWQGHQFRFFRIWFVLQRYEKTAIRPFMTNMAAEIVISGGRP